MRIVSLEPYITETLISFGLGESVVGVSSRCPICDDLPNADTVSSLGSADTTAVEHILATEGVDLARLTALKPDIVLAAVKDVEGEEPTAVMARARAEIIRRVGQPVKLFSYRPTTLEAVFSFISDLGRNVGVPDKGRATASKIKAQFMDWADNFYDRMKNKKVSFICSLEPLTIGGYWIPDMIKMNSAVPQFKPVGEPPVQVSWEDLVKFKPDVIVVAPQGVTLEESMKSFTVLEEMPHWEEIPAVKRGEVFFADGINHFYSPTTALIDSMAILVSAIAGFESGYITKRDSFYKLRWLELQRHRFKK